MAPTIDAHPKTFANAIIRSSDFRQGFSTLTRFFEYKAKVIPCASLRYRHLSETRAAVCPKYGSVFVLRREGEDAVVHAPGRTESVQIDAFSIE
jgi:hypothetical protein